MTTNGKPVSGKVKKIKAPGLPSQLLLFAKNFAKHPNMIGWMFPSSRHVVEQVLRQIDWGKARVIVEYGPGVGTFTRDILERMHPDAKLIALETNGEFCRYLNDSVRDSRFILLHESATEIDSALKRHGLPPADCVISGIPFKTIPEELRGEIVRKTHAALRPQGQFLVYQLTGVVRPYLESVFGRVRHDFEFLSIPPGRLFYCAR
ncbi:MAG: methyltransferase [Akkermansiaceae bacterium]|nr:methyltransferase [Verrucomicrobiales bacterium]